LRGIDFTYLLQEFSFAFVARVFGSLRSPEFTPASSAPRSALQQRVAGAHQAEAVPRTWRGERRAIEQMTQPKSSKCEDGVAIAGRLISRPQVLLLLASAGVASVV